MREGWIKVWRKIEDNPVLFDSIRYSLFVRLLNRAACYPCRVWFKDRWFDLQRGEALMTEREMSKLLNCDRQRIRSALKVLEGAEMINRHGNPGLTQQLTQHLTQHLTQPLTKVTICNYDHYQRDYDGANPAPNPQPNHPVNQNQPTEKEGEEGKKDIDIGSSLRSEPVALAKPKQRKSSSKLAPRNGYPPWFEELWLSYPKRDTDTKSNAFCACEKAVAAGNTESELLDGARRYAAYISRSGEPPKLVQTWINAQGWTAAYSGSGQHERYRRPSAVQDLYKKYLNPGSEVGEGDDQPRLTHSPPTRG